MLVGDKFGRFTVLGIYPRNKKRRVRGKALCRCNCGAEKVVNRDDLKSGHTKSCGCMARERTAARNTNHGLSGTPEYRIWAGIKTRCYNPKASNYRYYGGRGIRMCGEWLNSFEQLLSDMGNRPAPGHTVDRINADGPYEPGNCRWATHVEQMRNRRSTKITMDDVTEMRRLSADGMSHKHIAEMYGMSKSGVGHAIRGRTWAA